MAETNIGDKPEWLALHEMFQTVVNHPITTNWRTNADRSYAFEQGDQWTEKEKRILKDRNMAAVVENEIRPAKERLLGKFRRFRTTVRFVGRNNQDEELANAISDLMRHIDYINMYEFVEGDVGNDMLISGKGVLEASIEEVAGYKCVKYHRRDPFALFVDPYSRAYDWNEDAKYMAYAEWGYVDDFIARWPHAAKDLRMLGTTGVADNWSDAFQQDPDVHFDRNTWYSLYVDEKLNRIRPVEIYWKERVKKQVIETADGKMHRITVSKRNAKEIAEKVQGRVLDEVSEDQIMMAVFCAGIMLVKPRPKDDGVNLFPFIPYKGFVKASGELQGYIWALIDPQREINARRTRALWFVNNRQAIFERGAVRDKNDLAEELAQADGLIELQDGKMDKFQIAENADISQGNLQMLQEAKMAIRRTIGEDIVTPNTEVRSGSQLAKVQQEMQDAVLTLFDNLRRSRRLKARYTYELIREHYDNDILFYVTDEPNQKRQVQIKASDFDAMRQYHFDLVAEDVTDYKTTDEEQFAELNKSIPQIAQLGRQWAGLLVSMSSLRNKDGVMKIIESMGEPPPTEPKLTINVQYADLPPAERAAIAERMQVPGLAQAIQGEGTPARFVLQEEADMQKAKVKAMSDIKATAIQGEASLTKAQIDAKAKKEAKRESREE